MRLKFLTGEPALEFNKTLVVADLHIGIETSYRKSGIFVPTQIAEMKAKIDSLIKKTRIKRLVIIGDIKDRVPGVSLQEIREVPEFFNYFSHKLETHICLGNHDSEIPALVENVKIHGTDGFRLDDTYIMHGHSWPKKEFLSCKCLIVSHTHPLIEIKDRLGYRFLERVWIKAKFDREKLKEKYGEASRNPPEIILMPAFNWLCGGVALNSEIKNRQKNKEEFFGPLTKLIEKKETEAFLLDGTHLGRLDDLKNARI